MWNVPHDAWNIESVKVVFPDLTDDMDIKQLGDCLSGAILLIARVALKQKGYTDIPPSCDIWKDTVIRLAAPYAHRLSEKESV